MAKSNVVLINGQPMEYFSKPLSKQIWEHKWLYVFVFPLIIWLLVFSYYPMYGATLAWKGFKYNLGIVNSPWVGWKWFEEFVNSPEFWITMGNTIKISLMKLAFCWPAPILLALLLNEVKGMKFKRVIQTLSYLPNFVSWVVVIQLMQIIFTPYGGVINSIRASMGLPSIFFMGEVSYFYPMIILSDIWKGIGWGSIIYLSALSSVSMDLYEAAALDGAGRLKQTWHVTLPGIKGVLGIQFIFATGGILNAGFDQLLLIAQPSTKHLAQILDTYTLEKGLKYGKFELASAVGIFKSIFALGLMTLTNWISNKVMEVGIW